MSGAEVLIGGHPGLLDPAAEMTYDYEGEESRYAIYVVDGDRSRVNMEGGIGRKRLAETSRDGIGLTLVTLRDEQEITEDLRVGIFDRLDRRWLVNPWARGDLR